MRSKFQRFKKSVQSHYDEGQNKIVQIITLIEQLHQLRLIEKIARPIPFEQKERIFAAFKQKFIQLHQLLDFLKKQVPKQNESGNERAKGTNSTMGVRQKLKRQDIRKIQSAYSEVLIQSSFKYYYLVAKVQGLPLNLQVINIQEWAASCLDQQTKTSCC